MLHVCIFLEEEYLIEELEKTNFLNEIVIQNTLNLVEENKNKVTFTLCQKNIFGIQEILSRLYNTDHDAVFVDLTARLNNDFVKLCNNLLLTYDVVYNKEKYFFLIKNKVIKTMLDDEDDMLKTTTFDELVDSLDYKYNVEKINFS